MLWRTGIGTMIVLLAMTSVGRCGGGLRCVLIGANTEEDSQWIVEHFRNMGPDGLVAALWEYDKIDSNNPAYQDLALQCANAIDQIAGQRHATVSRLYWYTDLEAAKAQAAKTGKPILSLRMLGKLTNEYSCANSRFFRTALYANEAISNTLRDNFVLHWQSVRPVPKVTVDFGDGRRLERTVTGNSAHYVLNATGRPLDVLPGLYSPKEFQAWLERSQQLFADYLASAENGEPILQEYHTRRLEFVDNAFTQDRQAVSAQVESPRERFSDRPPVINPENNKPFPTAKVAATAAFGKTAAEAPIVNVVSDASQTTDDQLWQSIAALHREEVKLDGRTIELMRQQAPNAFTAGAVATTKRVVEDPILKVVRNFENSIAVDTVRNEYLLHRQIHRWFVEGTAPADFDALNERVYAELFLTPSSDPWLGLAPPDAYTALDRGGLSVAEETSAWVAPDSSLE